MKFKDFKKHLSFKFSICYANDEQFSISTNNVEIIVDIQSTNYERPSQYEFLTYDDEDIIKRIIVDYKQDISIVNNRNNQLILTEENNNFDFFPTAIDITINSEKYLDFVKSNSLKYIEFIDKIKRYVEILNYENFSLIDTQYYNINSPVTIQFFNFSSKCRVEFVFDNICKRNYISFSNQRLNKDNYWDSKNESKIEIDLADMSTNKMIELIQKYHSPF